MTAQVPLLISGPTASGKSALALRLAAGSGAVIVNADALQVYDCWQVLSARPGPDDLARAPHALYGQVAGDRRYSVGDWLRDVEPLVPALRTEGRPMIFVGGTGLYLEALTRGLARIPAVPAEVRTRSEARLSAGDLQGLVAELDPKTRAAIDVSNPRRVQRAWEVQAATGQGLVAWQAATAAPLVPEFVGWVVERDKESLHKDIELRLHKMVELGALEECRRYAAAFADSTLPSSRVLGAAELLAHLRGEATLDEAVAAAAVATRQYAKRQRSWFRNRFATWTRVSPEGQSMP